MSWISSTVKLAIANFECVNLVQMYCSGYTTSRAILEVFLLILKGYLRVWLEVRKQQEILDDADSPIVEFAWMHRQLFGNDCWNYQAVA